jgi:hypothetical protein
MPWADSRFPIPVNRCRAARTKTGFAFAEFPADEHNVGSLRASPWHRSAANSAMAAG